MTKNIRTKKQRTEEISIKKKVSKDSIESSYDLELVDGTKAYYSERYGWTLRRLK